MHKPGRLVSWLLLTGAPLVVAAEPARVLDDMSEPSAWHAVASDDVSAQVASVARGGALRLSFDFNHRSGFAVAERVLPLDLPQNFELQMVLQGDLAGNDLEVKLLDASGENVWWFRQPALEIPAAGRVLRIRRRQIEFAWGPAADHELRHVERLQFAVTAKRGGAGALEIGAIRLVLLPPPPPVWPGPVGRAGGQLVRVPDGSPMSDWRCVPDAQAACELVVDWQLVREFGGVRVEWGRDRRPSRYELSLSTDGVAWHVVRRVTGGATAVDWLWLPESEARYLRLAVIDALPAAVSLHRIDLEDPEFGSDRNRLVTAIAREHPRSHYPRGFTEQAYWTIVGTDAGSHSGLLSEDGALETDVGGPSVEPFIVEDGRLVGWADVTAEQSLADGYLPIPSVRWRTAAWMLDVTAFAAGVPEGRLYGRYTVRNLAAARRHLTLLLALRPFQVNPPAQFLNTPGGVSPIARLAWDCASFRTGGGTAVVPLLAPDRVGAFTFESGAVPAELAARGWGAAPGRPIELRDDSGLASGVMAFDLDLQAGAAATVGLVVPWSAADRAATKRGPERLDVALGTVRREWRERLDHFGISAPDAAEATEVANAVRTAEAHLLVSRKGPVLRPGTRSYARSWIRDGAMIAAALLRLGETRAPKDYLRWYSNVLFDNGKVPCCVDDRGADPVPENDSAGEFIYLAAEVYRLSGDRKLVASLWPRIRLAAEYLDGLRRSTRGSPADGAVAGPYFGLLPPSISHEGYSAKPMHSYWDDFWGLRGYSDAVFLARALGESLDAARYERARAEFARDIAASIAQVTRTRSLDFVPGAADLGDFDATATTIAVAPGPGPIDLPPGLLQSTFERYWCDFVARRDGTRQWDAYTPYEWRTVGTFVRLGWRERALEALEYLMAGRRPPAWNQWPEVTGREPRVARFIGDLPHGWVASDFIRSALDLFAYDGEADGTIVLAAGVPLRWLDGRGVAVRGIRSRYGTVAYHVQHAAGAIDLELEAGAGSPPGGFILRLPGLPQHGAALVNGRPESFDGGAIRLRSAPARVHVDGY